MQEQELIEKCIKGHRISQRKLYDTYKTPMYTLAYRITNSFEDAEDVLQEGFLKVFRNLDSFKNDSKLSTWIHTIIVRKAFRKIKDTINYNTTAFKPSSKRGTIGFSLDAIVLEL